MFIDILQLYPKRVDDMMRFDSSNAPAWCAYVKYLCIIIVVMFLCVRPLRKLTFSANGVRLARALCVFFVCLHAHAVRERRININYNET